MKAAFLFFVLSTAPLLAADPPKPGTAEAKVEPMRPGGVRVDVKLDPQQRNPSKHRTYKIHISNVSSFFEDLDYVTYQFSGEKVTDVRPGSVTRVNPRFSAIITVEMDIAPENGWAFVVRRKTGDLVAIKASAQRFEALARQQGRPELRAPAR